MSMSNVPRCERDDKSIFDVLPHGCPFQAERARDELIRIQGAAWAADFDSIRAVDGKRTYDTCYRCVYQQGNHPKIRRLRAQERRCEPVTVGVVEAARPSNGNGWERARTSGSDWLRQRNMRTRNRE